MDAFQNLDWPVVLRHLVGFATSDTGRRRLEKTEPLASPAEALLSFSEIHEAQAVLKLGARPYAESLDLFGSWFQRLDRQAVLKTLELKDVRHFCIEVIALREILSSHSGTWVERIREALFEAAEPLSAIEQIMTPDGAIRSDASEHLFKLNKEKNDQIRQVQRILDKLVKAHQMEPLLQDKYVTNREGRWVLPIKSGMQHSFDGLIHASSQSKQTVFMEPTEIIPLNNRLSQIELEIEYEIERLLAGLSEYLHSRKIDFQQARDLLLEVDVRMAQAQLSNRLNAQACSFTQDRMVLKSIRHPALVMADQKVIPNSVELGRDRRLLLLSGPNAGGKTVLLKSIGLAAHMARCGLPICGDRESELPFFKRIHVAVGDAQSVDAHLSTFAAHLKVLNQATQAHGPRELVLIDEICGATDPEEGSALARAFIETYAVQGVFGVVTSHLGPLKTGWTKDLGVINGSLEFSPNDGPTYQFFMGVPGQSLAIQTARRVGVAQNIVERALAHLSPETRAYQDKLQEVESLRESLQALQHDLDQQARRVRQDREKYEALIQKFQLEKERMLDQALKRAEKKIEKLIKFAKVDESFRKFENLEQVKNQMPQIVKGSPKNKIPSTRIETPEQFAQAFPPGSRVYSQSLSQDAIVQGRPNAKGEVPILSNSMRIVVTWDTLTAPELKSNPTQEVLRRSDNFHLTQSAENITVDLRGLSIDDALTQLDEQLDRARLMSSDRVKVIHGHGTEALKRAVRSHLSRSTYVAKWQTGMPENGGDGITWVELE